MYGYIINQGLQACHLVRADHKQRICAVVPHPLDMVHLASAPVNVMPVHTWPYVSAIRHNSRDSPAKARGHLANRHILILNHVVKKSCNGNILVAATF